MCVARLYTSRHSDIHICVNFKLAKCTNCPIFIFKLISLASKKCHLLFKIRFNCWKIWVAVYVFVWNIFIRVCVCVCPLFVYLTIITVVELKLSIISAKLLRSHFSLLSCLLFWFLIFFPCILLVSQIQNIIIF